MLIFQLEKQNKYDDLKRIKICILHFDVNYIFYVAKTVNTYSFYFYIKIPGHTSTIPGYCISIIDPYNFQFIAHIYLTKSRVKSFIV